MGNLSLSSPWIRHYRKIQALFKYDSDVNVVLDESNEERPVVTLFVSEPDKAAALEGLIKSDVEFGNVTMRVLVRPANSKLQTPKLNSPYTRYYRSRHEFSRLEPTDLQKRFDAAFTFNRAYRYTTAVTGLGGCIWTYPIFSNNVVQYPSDDISDYFGVTSTLYEDIARDVLIELSGVFYCTELKKGSREEGDEEKCLE